MPTVADLLIDGLVLAGAPRLFCGAGDEPVDALSRAAEARGLPVVPVASEWAACVMAAVTGELIDAPGAAVVGLASAAAAGLAHARRDRAPVILIAGPAPSTEDRAATTVLVKQLLTVEADSVSHWIAHAARLAMKGPRGPVCLELAADLAGKTAAPVVANPRPGPPPPPAAVSLDTAARLIAAANRPLVVAGLGCRGEDAGWVRAFAEALPAPVLTTLKAKGTMPEPHPLSLGVLVGSPLELPIARRADLIVAIGLDRAELPARPWLPAPAVLHLGRDAAEGLPYGPAAEVIAEPSLTLAELAPRLRSRARADWDVAELDRLKREQSARTRDRGLTLASVVEVARALTPAGTIAAIDGGAAMLPAALAWRAVARGECLVPNRLATRGFALPAAIAAQLAHPDRRVLCVTTGPGLMRGLAELHTATRARLPVVVLAVDGEVDDLVAAAARAFRCPARGAASRVAVERALAAALAEGGPALVVARPMSPSTLPR